MASLQHSLDGIFPNHEPFDMAHDLDWRPEVKTEVEKRPKGQRRDVKPPNATIRMRAAILATELTSVSSESSMPKCNALSPETLIHPIIPSTQ